MIWILCEEKEILSVVVLELTSIKIAYHRRETTLTKRKQKVHACSPPTPYMNIPEDIYGNQQWQYARTLFNILILVLRNVWLDAGASSSNIDNNNNNIVSDRRRHAMTPREHFKIYLSKAYTMSSLFFCCLLCRNNRCPSRILLSDEVHWKGDNER